MLRCGLRVEKVANLTFDAIDLKRKSIYVHNGEGGKDRVVYISKDAHDALVPYLSLRPSSRAKKLFLVEKGTYRGKPISVRGIQKRIQDHYGRMHPSHGKRHFTYLLLRRLDDKIQSDKCYSISWLAS